jgi:hypothetical protein
MARKRKSRKLSKRYGHARRRRGHFNLADSGVSVRVHGQLFLEPESIAEVIESPQLEAIIEEVVEEVVPEVVEETVEAIGLLPEGGGE